MNNVGETIRAARKKQGLTIDEVAARSDLSKGYISKVERGLCSPSYSCLQKIFTTLKINSTDFVFVSDDSAEQKVVRANERDLLYDYNGSILFESIHRTPHFSLEVLSYNGESDNYSVSQHAFDEILLGAKGQTLVILGGSQRVELGEGDMVYITKGTKHHIQKATSENSMVYVIEIYD